MQKKFLLIPLALLLAISLVAIGCPAEETTTPPTTTSPTTTSPTTTSPTTSGPTPEEPLVLIFASFAPTELPPPIDYDPYEYAWDAWCDTIEEESGGRVVFERYPLGSLVGIGEMYEALQKGVCDVAPVYPPGNPGKFPLTQLVLGLPGLYSNATVGSMLSQKVFDEGYNSAEWDGVHYLFACQNLASDLVCRTKQVKTLEDWAGLKVGCSGEPFTSTVEALGATPVGVPVLEGYLALERGTIDAYFQELHGHVSLAFYEAGPYSTACQGPSMGNHFCMSQETYDSLPEDIREIVDRNSGMLWALIFGRRMDTNTARAIYYLEQYREDRGEPPIYYPTDEELARWQEAWKPAIDKTINELEAEGLPAQAMLDRIRELEVLYSDYNIGGVSYPGLEWFN